MPDGRRGDRVVALGAADQLEPGRRAAISITAVRPSSRHAASTGSPSGPVTVVVRLGPPSASSVPSPPSAIGTSSQSQPSSKAASPIALATAAADAVPRSLSGAATTRTPPCWHCARRGRGRLALVDTVGPPMAPAPPDRPIVLVSNRGPVSFERDDDGALASKRGAGGLVSGIGPLVADGDVTWLAAAMSDGDREAASAGRGRGRRLPRPAARPRPGDVPPRLRRGEQRGALVRAPRAVGPHPGAGLRRRRGPTRGTPTAR